MPKTSLIVSVAFIFLGTTFSAIAGPGVLEINQSCAINGGCFSGDSPGFPVTIDGSAGKSYQLTGDLDLSSVPDTTAIEISSPFVTLDLNGFEIAGPVTCTGSGGSLNCGTPGSANGIKVNSSNEGVLIRNGTARNMSGSGVSSDSARATLVQLRSYNNARDGFRGGAGSIVADCIAGRNGDDGFDFGVTSVIERSTAQGNGGDGFEIEFQRGVVTLSTARYNGGRGFNFGHSARFSNNTSEFNDEPDRCGGGVCTERRRFFLTRDFYDGNEVLTACPDGFHMASLPEILNPGALQYDFVLGYTELDSGQGLPLSGGWIRTGITNTTKQNCSGWSSDLNDENHSGTTVYFDLWNTDDPATNLNPMIMSRRACWLYSSVWCIED